MGHLKVGSMEVSRDIGATKKHKNFTTSSNMVHNVFN